MQSQGKTGRNELAAFCTRRIKPHRDRSSDLKTAEDGGPTMHAHTSPAKSCGCRVAPGFIDDRGTPNGAKLI